MRDFLWLLGQPYVKDAMGRTSISALFNSSTVSGPTRGGSVYVLYIVLDYVDSVD